MTPPTQLGDRCCTCTPHFKTFAHHASVTVTVIGVLLCTPDHKEISREYIGNAACNIQLEMRCKSLNVYSDIYDFAQTQHTESDMVAGHAGIFRVICTPGISHDMLSGLRLIALPTIDVEDLPGTLDNASKADGKAHPIWQQ
jgi:hypothetical protein